jgi:hypothetical protein
MINLPVPDTLAEEIKAEAQAEGISVPDLLTELLQERRKAQRKRLFPQGEELTKNLDEVYEKEPSTVDPVLMTMQLRSLDREEW